MDDDALSSLRRAADRVATGVRRFNRRPATVEVLRRIRRALPGDPQFGDPLSLAGRDSAGAMARLAERLFDDEAVATREVSLGALQVWQSLLERAGRGHGDAELTVLFTDLVGFSSWAVKAGDDEALVLLRQVAAAAEPPVLAHRGRIVKRLGDGFMAVFPAPQPAFEAAVAAQRAVRGIEVGGYVPSLRAGIHTGRPRALGGDYLGVDVNIAARLTEKASGDEVLVSETALAGLEPDRVATRRKKTFRLTRVKGVPDDLAVFVATPRAPAAG
jgi:adenylate cyclase